jgi:flagellar hook capping protein FlgD
MKTLLNKKLTNAFAAFVLFTSITNAQQIPDKLKNLPPFKLRAEILSSLNKPHAHIVNDMRSSSNAPCLKAQNSLGGSSYDEGHYIIQTKDGGFLVCGLTFSNDGDFHATDITNGDAYVAKYNKLRQLEWTKTYGGSGNDVFNNIAQTYDGGYIATGQTTSNDGDVSGNHGNNDVWLVKLSASGKIEWQKCFGGSGDDLGEAVVQTSYGGYAVACFVNSNDGNVSGNHNTDGDFDGWFFQVSAKGNLLFQHCYGGSDFDGFFAMVPSYGGSFILYGASSSNDGDVSGNHGNGDAWVVKVNAFGKILWQRAVGGSGSEEVGANEITTVNDGNVVIDGGSNSTDGDINASNDTSNSFVTKLNAATGAIIWSKSYAEPSLRFGSGIFATKDGGAVETGDVATSSDFSTQDVLISKFDKNGNEEWYKRLGGSEFDGSVNGYETFNGDLNILCQTASTDGDVKYNHGNVDEWIIKLGPCGEQSDNETGSDIPEKALGFSKDNGAVSLSNYPNPLSSSTNISFTLSQSQKVSVSIFDLNGRLVKNIADGNMEAGTHQLMWDTKDNNGNTALQGVYFIRVETLQGIQTKKIIVVK